MLISFTATSSSSLLCCYRRCLSTIGARSESTFCVGVSSILVFQTISPDLSPSGLRFLVQICNILLQIAQRGHFHLESLHKVFVAAVEHLVIQVDEEVARVALDHFVFEEELLFLVEADDQRHG